jgi:hypothetical protein
MKKNLGLGGSLVLSVGLTACGNRLDRDGSKLANIAGEDSSTALLIGQGYNPVQGAVKGFCVDVGNLETQSGNSTGQMAEFRLLEIESESALREALNVSASASFTGTVGRASARASFAESVNKNRSSRYLLVHTRVANQLEVARSFEFTDSATRLLKQGDSEAFLKHCGSEFVYGRRTGGEFFAVFEFSFVSSEEEKAFSSAISGSGAGWKMAGSVNEELSKFGKFASTQIKMYVVGGSAAFPWVDSLADFGAKFNTMVNLTQSNAVTLELLTKDYDGVEPIELRPNTELLVRQRYVMEQLGMGRDAAREILNTVRVVKTHPENYESVDLEHLNESESKLNVYLNSLNDAAVECFANAVQSCKVPSASLPFIVMPKKRYGLTCRQTTRPECLIIDDNSGCLAFKMIDSEVCN